MSDMQQDRFGNPFAAGVPYARGDFVGSTADDLRKLGHAWSMIRKRIGGGSTPRAPRARRCAASTRRR